MNTVARVAALTLAAVMAWVLADPPASVVPGVTNSQPAQTVPAAGDDLFKRPLHGVAIQLHGSALEVPNFERMIDEIAALGADTVQLVTHGWQTHGGTADLRLDQTRNPSLPDLERLCVRAKQRGLRVVLMPVVLLSNPRNTEWRGQIIPTAGWDLWFRRYTDFMIQFADLSERSGVDVLMVGSELIKAEQFTERWRSLIAELRGHFRGKLGYSANWDHYTTDKIGFWPQLDCVGMTSYYTLATGPRPEQKELLRNWEPIRQRILDFQKQVRLPIIFTEAGWCSQEGAASESWNYYHNTKATPAGHQEQADCYDTFIRTWDGVPELGGIIWWEWTSGPGGAADYGYTPKNKPAEKILRDWFAKKNGNGANGTKRAAAAPQ